VIAQKLSRLAFAFHYKQCRMMNRLLPSITLDNRKLKVFSTIYKPLENEHRMIDWLKPNKTVLDVGCGSGVLSVFASTISKHVTAIDINPQAVENTVLNCNLLGIKNVTAKVSDLFSAVEGRFDYIITYPPLYQLPFAKDHEQWATSTRFVKELFQQVPRYLNPGGRLVIMLPSWYRPTPQTLAAEAGLRVVETHSHVKRPLKLLIHSIPYFHLSMKHSVYELEVTAPTMTPPVAPVSSSDPGIATAF